MNDEVNTFDMWGAYTIYRYSWSHQSRKSDFSTIKIKYEKNS